MIFGHVLQMLAWLFIMVAPVPVSASRISPSRQGLAESLLDALVLWTSIQCALGLALGWLHLLSMPALIAVELAVLAAGLWQCRGHTLSTAAQWRDACRGVMRLPACDKLIVCFIATFALALTWRSATIPVSDFDSLRYHLPAVASWYQGQSFTFPDWMSPEQWSRYSYNWEVLSALFVVPFGDDFLASMPNVLAWLLQGLSIYCLSTRLGARRTYGLAYSLLVLCTMVVLRQVNTLHVDLALSAFFIAALYYLVALRKSPAQRNLRLLLICMAMMCGIKSSGLVYAGILLLASIFIVGSKMYATSCTGSIKRMVNWRIAGTVIFSAFLGTSWYCNNIAEMGNPLGYVEIRLGNQLLVPGVIPLSVVRQSTIAYMFCASDPGHWKILWQCCCAELGLPVLIIATSILLSGLWRASTGRGRRLAALLLMVNALLLLMYWFAPYSGNNTHLQHATLDPWIGQGFRYGLPFLSFLAVTGATLSSPTALSPWYITGFCTIASFLSLNQELHFISQLQYVLLHYTG